MRYTIGDVSKAFRISKNTLRYYEEKGILNPDHCEENDYRYYKDEQMHQMGSIKKWRNLGLSFEDIRHLFDGVDNGTVEDILRECIDREEKELCLKQYRIRLMQQYLEQLKHRELYGKPYMEKTDERYLLQLSHINHLVDDRSLQKVAPEWFEHIFPVVKMERMKIEEIERGRYEAFSMLSIDTYGAGLLGIVCENRHVLKLPARRCAAMIGEFDMHKEDMNALVEEMAEICEKMKVFCRKQGHVPGTDIDISSLFVYKNTEGRSVRFCKIELAVDE